VVADGTHGPAELRDNRHWRTAVWALRFGFLALVVGIVGLVASARWVVAIGVIGWLVAAAITLTGVFRARRELPEPRPGFWPLRWMLLHDTVHARHAT
jgi:hypothetical protein